jgi:hypothetical protein
MGNECTFAQPCNCGLAKLYDLYVEYQKDPSTHSEFADIATQLGPDGFFSEKKGEVFLEQCNLSATKEGTAKLTRWLERSTVLASLNFLLYRNTLDDYKLKDRDKGIETVRKDKGFVSYSICVNPNGKMKSVDIDHTNMDGEFIHFLVYGLQSMIHDAYTKLPPDMIPPLTPSLLGFCFTHAFKYGCLGDETEACKASGK